MVSPLECYQQRSGTPWLYAAKTPLSPQFEAVFEQRYRQLLQQDNPPIVLLAESQPAVFLASFLAACAAQCPIFLANPRWRDREWRAALTLAQPRLVWRNQTTLPGASQPPDADACAQSGAAPERRWIMIPTGGTSGQLKFAIHTWDTLSASVQGFCQYFTQGPVNACCTLPLYHVSGLMQFVRALRSGGQLVIQPWRSLAGPLAFEPEGYFLSLVPAQLQGLLTSPAAIAALRRFSAVLVGGAPAWPALLERGRSLRLPLAPTYGMTETASQVATLKPQDFLAGRVGCGTSLPHAQVRVIDEQGRITPGTGRIAIAARSLYLGYYPHATYPTQLETDDLGYVDADGLHLVGRRSDMIISGGENVFPAEVEAAIWATGLVADVAVVGVADERWGETPVALYVPQQSVSGSALSAQPEANAIKTALASQLSRYKHPSRWLAVPHLPRTPQGKLDRSALQGLARQAPALSAPVSGSAQS